MQPYINCIKVVLNVDWLEWEMWTLFMQTSSPLSLAMAVENVQVSENTEVLFQYITFL